MILFPNLEYLHVPNEISWECDPRLNTKFICISQIPYTHSLNVISYSSFALQHSDMKSGVKFSTCDIMLALKKFQILEYLGF